METIEGFRDKLYKVNESNFEEIAVDLFNFQYRNNRVYREYVDYRGVAARSINGVGKIPFLPIRFFKNRVIQTGNWHAERVFESSGTTVGARSRHYIMDAGFYTAHAVRCFEFFLGPVHTYAFFAWLPSYQPGAGSSLLTMINEFIRRNPGRFGGLYADGLVRMLSDLGRLAAGAAQVRPVVWSVPDALLDLAEAGTGIPGGCLVLETGGMKGRRREITREELHERIKHGLGVGNVLSEYGMTELSSQAYALADGKFRFPPWANVLIREVNDPFCHGLVEETGGINVVDLANFHSIAFIETEDLGRAAQDGSFEVLGRLDNSDLRGCNLLIG